MEREAPARVVPWTGLELFLALSLAYAVWPVLVSQVLLHSGLFRVVYGPDFAAEVASAAAGAEKDGDRSPSLARLALWSAPLSLPLQVATFPLVFGAFSGTRPAQLGLSGRRFLRNLLAGLAAAAFLVPTVIGLNYLLVFLYGLLVPAGTQEHPIAQLAQQHLLPVEWFLLVCTAVLAAPLLEELVFRGALQPWFASRPWGSHLALALAFLLALLLRSGRIRAARAEGGLALFDAFVPALFVLALVPFYLLVWRRRPPFAPPVEDTAEEGALAEAGMEWLRPRPRVVTAPGPAIFATAALFASAHASVWPTPVALFVLALGLGTLAHRTGSLVGPVVLHALLNGFSCVVLIWSVLKG